MPVFDEQSIECNDRARFFASPGKILCAIALGAFFYIPQAVFSQVFSTKDIKPVFDVNLVSRPVSDDYKTVAGMTKGLTNDQKITKNKLELLHYYHALGFTHVYYYIEGNDYFKFAGGSWNYDKGPEGTKYTDGIGAHAFRVTKQAFEDNGLVMIPLLFNPLSHAENQIESDPSLGEFGSAAAYAAYTATNHYGLLPAYFSKADSTKDVNYHNFAGMIAFVGDYANASKHNISADKLFEENLKLVNANWTFDDKTGAPKAAFGLGGAYPQYVHIGHDELGDGTACLVAESRGRGLLAARVTKSDLIAREIAYRYYEIQTLLAIRGSNPVQVMLWGDSFVPGDHGAHYLNVALPSTSLQSHFPAGATTLCGDLTTGAGGVLDKLKNDSTVKSIARSTPTAMYLNLIIMPWAYNKDGYYYRGALGHIWPANIPLNNFDIPAAKYDKNKQAAYLSKLGYKYIPLTGEGAPPTNPVFLPEAGISVFEWVKAIQANPSHCIGLGYSCWQLCYKQPGQYNIDYTSDAATDYYAITDSNVLKSGFQAAMAAYAGWSDCRKKITTVTYHDDFFKNCNYLRARNRQTWAKGSDYSAF